MQVPTYHLPKQIVRQSLKISQNVSDPSSISLSLYLSLSLSLSQSLSVSLSLSQSLSLSFSYEKEMLLRDRKALGCLCRGSLRRVRLQQLAEIGVLTIATIVWGILRRIPVWDRMAVKCCVCCFLFWSMEPKLASHFIPVSLPIPSSFPRYTAWKTSWAIWFLTPLRKQFKHQGPVYGFHRLINSICLGVV
jgi:hypothetical protein